jgi:hypothetical protein
MSSETKAMMHAPTIGWQAAGKTEMLIVRGGSESREPMSLSAKSDIERRPTVGVAARFLPSSNEPNTTTSRHVQTPLARLRPNGTSAMRHARIGDGEPEWPFGGRSGIHVVASSRRWEEVRGRVPERRRFS